MNDLTLANCQLLLPNRTVGTGDLVIADGKIAELRLRGTQEAERRGPDAADGAVLDCRGRLVLPGLVNCHCHAPMTLLRGVGGGLPLQRWLTEAIFPLEAKLTDADVHAGAVWGAH